MTVKQGHLLDYLVQPEVGVETATFEPNFDALAWTTIANLFDDDLKQSIRDECDTDLDTLAFDCFLFMMRRLPPQLNFYLSPTSLVTSGHPTREFIDAACREKRSWHHRLRTIFFTSSGVQRAFGLKGRLLGNDTRNRKERSKESIIRQLQFHGVLVVEGRHIFPDCWPDPSRQNNRFSLVGSRFGRLVVLEDLSSQKHRCRCDCGNMKVADRNHLRSGRSKSCGCLAKERQAQIEARRYARDR